MKKRVMICVAAAVLLICVGLYFRPLALTDVAAQGQEIRVLLSRFTIRDGEPDIEVTEYQTLTEEQRGAVMAALEDHRYRRTIGTLLSDGTLEDLGEKMLSIHVYDDTSVDSIVLTDSGQIAINDKSYRMKDAQELIGRILELVEGEG